MTNEPTTARTASKKGAGELTTQTQAMFERIKKLQADLSVKIQTRVNSNQDSGRRKNRPSLSAKRRRRTSVSDVCARKARVQAYRSAA